MNNRFFTIQDLHYWTGIENKIIDVDGNGGEVTFSPAKKLMIRNDGPSGAYFEFSGKSASLESSFLLYPSDGLVEIPAQCDRISAICTPGETARIRVALCR